MPGPIRILSGGAMRTLMDEALPLFARATGVPTAIDYRLTAVLKAGIEAGAAFDVALLPRPELESLAEGGWIAPPLTDIARSAVGVCVREGAPKPDISTAAAVEAALRSARSVAYSDGPSGAYVADLVHKLGLAEDVGPKTRLTSRPVAELVAAGEAEIGLQQIVAMLPVKGIALVGALPAALQNIIIYAAGVSISSPNTAAARRCIAFMRTAEVLERMRAKGLERG
jgi:molybdate transport system substrate-binding protein